MLLLLDCLPALRRTFPRPAQAPLLIALLLGAVLPASAQPAEAPAPRASPPPPALPAGLSPDRPATTAASIATAAATNPLSLAQAMAAAVAQSTALPAQDAVARAARERAVAAGQRPDPVLRIGLDNVPIEGGSDRLFSREPTTARSIGISQALPTESKRRARAQRFEQDASLALAGRQLRETALRRETALAWWALHTEQQRLTLIDAQLAEAALAEQGALAAYRAQRGSQTEVFASRYVQARLDDQRLQAQARLANARSSLRRWIGNAADQPLASPPPLTSLPPDLLKRAASADPELLLAAARESSARAGVALAREERSADWSVDLRFAQRASRFDNMVTLGLSLPLRWDLPNRQDRELAARSAELEQVQAETEDLQRVRAAEVERWHERWRTGLARLAGVDEAQLPLAAARTDAALTAYRAGTGALQPVLDARQAELVLRLERLQIELETASDWARLATLLPVNEVPQ